MEREVLAVQKRVLGAEHPDTLAAAHILAGSLSHRGKHAEAEEMLREVLAVRKRVQGAEHPATLTTASNLARSLSDQGKHAEAEEMQRAVLVVLTCLMILVYWGGEEGAGGGASRHADNREQSGHLPL